MVKINILFFNLFMYHGLNMVCWINNYSVSTSDVELRPIFVALRNITEILSFGFLFRKMHWMSVLGTSWMMLSPSAHPLLPHKEIKMKRWHKHTHTYTYMYIQKGFKNFTENIERKHMLSTNSSDPSHVWLCVNWASELNLTNLYQLPIQLV